MKGFILAAGLGTRLKPWTDHHPKALAPAGGVPMLERVVEKLRDAGIQDLTVNVYHFADQIIDFIHQKGWKVNISDERPLLLETGGALLHAAPFLNFEANEPVLVHNADILSNADFKGLSRIHQQAKADITLLVSSRDSSRKLIFDSENNLRGWHNTNTGELRPENFKPFPHSKELAFSGIYLISQTVFDDMKKVGMKGKFSIIDYILSACNRLNIIGYEQENLKILDIGKPESLKMASEFLISDPIQ